MFEEMDKHFKQPKTKLQFDMVESLPILYNAIYPTAMTLATETRVQLRSTKEYAAKLARQNGVISTQNPLVDQILSKIKSITERATKLVQKNQKS